MARTLSFDDPAAARWRAFSRRGRHLAEVFIVLWGGLLFCLFRVVPPHAAIPPPPAIHITYMPDEWLLSGGRMADPRTLWSPAVFSLATSIGFSHNTYQSTPRLQLPDAIARTDGTLSVDDDFSGKLLLFGVSPAAPAYSPIVYAPPRHALTPAPAASNGGPMHFSAEWTAADFANLATNISPWTDKPWQAAADIRFTPEGLPASIMLTQASGLPEVDPQLTAMLYRIRLQRQDAPRRGTIFFRHLPSVANSTKGVP